MKALLIAVFLLPLGVFVGISFVRARWGWLALRQKYGPAPKDRPRMKWVSHAEVGRSFYGNLLFIGFDQRGVHLSPLFLIRPSHAPILIPWSEIGAPTIVDPFKGRWIRRGDRDMFMTHLVFPIGDPLVTTLALPAVFVKGTPLDPALRT